jgi:predicted transcriptional regulator
LKQILIFVVDSAVYRLYTDDDLILVEDEEGRVLIKRRGVSKQEINDIIKEIKTGVMKE